MEEYVRDYLDELNYINYEFKEGVYSIYCETKSTSMKNSTTNVITKSVKDRKKRTVYDIPFNNYPVKLIITIKLYSFKNENGKKYSIREPLSFIADKKRDSTQRLYDYILNSAASQSSHSTELVLRKQGIKISDTTIDRMIKKKHMK